VSRHRAECPDLLTDQGPCRTVTYLAIRVLPASPAGITCPLRRIEPARAANVSASPLVGSPAPCDVSSPSCSGCRRDRSRGRRGARTLRSPAARGRDDPPPESNCSAEPDQEVASPAIPRFTKRVRKEFYEAYSWFAAAFREAAEKLRRGDRDARFPPRKLSTSPAFCPRSPATAPTPAGVTPACPRALDLRPCRPAIRQTRGKLAFLLKGGVLRARYVSARAADGALYDSAGYSFQGWERL
jgi:hypothetical protein